MRSLKTEDFGPLRDGSKRFILCCDDLYQVGEKLELIGPKAIEAKEMEITYIERSPRQGLAPGWIILGFKPVEP